MLSDCEIAECFCTKYMLYVMYDPAVSVLQCVDYIALKLLRGFIARNIEYYKSDKHVTGMK